MREITLKSAIDGIRSGTKGGRVQGLKDFEQILKENRQSSKLQRLSDDDHGLILKSLFETVQEEKQHLFADGAGNAAKPISTRARDKSLDILSSCSHALRVFLEICTPSLRSIPTVRDAFDYILAETVNGDGEYFEPLLDDCFKAFQTILSHRPHLEHLSEKKWRELVRYCCASLRFVNSTVARTESTPSQLILSSRSGVGTRSKASSRAGTPLQGLENANTVPNQVKASDVSVLSSKRSDGLALCLDHLLSARHVNVLQVAGEVLPVVFETLKLLIEGNRPDTQQPCFSCLNTILFRAMTEDVELAKTAFISALYHIRRGWKPKMVTGLRDQMLITMLRCQPFIPSIIASEHDEAVSDLDGLLDRLSTVYLDRMADSMLSTNDLGLRLSGFEGCGVSFAHKTFCIRASSSSAESLWIQLCLMADLFNQLRISPFIRPSTQQDSGTHAKRIKHESPFQSLIGAIKKSEHREQLYSIQLLTFILATIRIERVDDLQLLLGGLFPLISKDSGEIAKWAMLALALISQQSLSVQASHREVTWLQVFQVSLAKLSSARVARFACNLTESLLAYGLVSFSDAVDSMDSLLLSVDVSGPAGLSDSAVDLWQTILALYNANRSASYESVSANVLRWFFGIWRPSQLGLRSLEASSNYSASVQHIMILTQLLVGEKGPPQVREGRQVLSTLARAKSICDEDSALTEFLVVGRDVSTEDSRNSNKKIVRRTEVRLSVRARRTALIAATDYLMSELEEFLSTQSESLAEKKLSLPNLRYSLITCIISLAVADIVARTDALRSNQLLNRAIELRDQTVKTFSRDDITSDGLKDMCHVLFAVFQDLKILPSKSFKDLSYFQLAIICTARPFGEVFWQNVRERLSSADDELLDMVPVEDSQDSVRGHSVATRAAGDIGRDWLSAYTDKRAYQNSVRADIHIASILPGPYSMSPDDASTLPSSVVDYLISLTPFDFLGCRPFLDDIYASRLEIGHQDGARLLAFLGTEIFESKDLERNEAAMGTCLDLMNHLVNHWAATDMETDLSHAASQLYKHFVKAAKRKILTPHVQVKMANMLQRVIKKDAMHGRSDNSPSARTNLFYLLETGGIRVKYQISQHIAAIFGFFVLREHDTILDDIEASIPHDPDSLEVTAVRLLLLSRLASSWSTLIRRCVYAIVDATGLMPPALPYARTCLKHLGKALGMRDLRELFRLFVPQILYTWLETRTVRSLPYHIFEYDSIHELVNDTKHEIASQVVMRGKETEVEDICELTNSSFGELLGESFGKCAAYCIARDTAVAPDADPQAANAALRLMAHVGRDEYGRLIAERFPEIVATFFKILDREDQILRSFAKNPSHAGAQEALEQMMTAGASQNTPPVSQQPSFRSNCLIDELDYVCRRSPYDSHNLWTPALFVYAFRGLLETVHPALGQLHAASVIRKIRILVCMARDVALSGYPLHMALGSLRAHLDNTHSAEDVMGLCRYLLNAGQSDLSQSISFLAGFIVSVLVSLKALVEKPQESTTQDVTFQATLSRAHEFRSWIENYVSSLDLSRSQKSSEVQQSFRDLVVSASRLGGHGSANRDSAEGELLFRLLDDEASGRRLVDEVTMKEVVLLLCKDFRYSGDFRSDIFSEGAAAASHASSALQLCGIDAQGRSFDLWIMRVLGRAYASQGFVEPSFRREAQDRKETADISHDADSASALVSASAIVRLLYQVACSHRTSEAGFAERTIQSVLSKAIGGSSTLKDVVHAIPRHASIAMDWQIFVPPSLGIQPIERRNLQAAFHKQGEMAFDDWCIQVCLALIDHAEEDSFLPDLRPSITVIRHFANRAFPYILHMILVQEAGRQEQTKKIVSGAIQRMMLDLSEGTHLHMKHVLNTIIYLRSQPMPFETTRSDRANWLDIDYRLAAEVAVQCKLFKTALLFVEIAISSESKVKGSRRSSAAKVDAPTDLLLQIFQNINEKDYYYGVRQPASLFSMMERLDMEQASFRSLSFRGAAFDMQSRRGDSDRTSMNALIRSLNSLELSSLSQSIATSADVSSDLSGEITFDAARKLEKWDIPCSDIPGSPAMTLFRTFQMLYSSNDRSQVMASIDGGIKSLLEPVYGSRVALTTDSSYWASLAALVEMEEILSSRGPQQLQEAWENLESRGEWFRKVGSEHIDRLLSSRETLFSVLDKNGNLQQLIKSPPKQVRQIQVMSLLESSNIYRSHGNLQKSLAVTTAIEQLLPSCEELGLKIEAAARVEVSNVLWDNGEMASSIRVLQGVCSNIDFSRQDIQVGKAELLAKLAERVSAARLEQPDEVLSHYLEPAVKELHGDSTGDAAGQVFHEFATFCDQQLQNSESEEDFRRIQKLRDDKAVEIQELDQMIKEAPARSKERENLKSYRTKAKQWYDLDSAEFKRLQNSRDTLLRQSLENYLRCLKACDTFDRDAVRFSALWLQHHDEDVANEMVASHIDEVASRKFATLMNQWTSRLLDEESQFQKLLSDLIYRICADHPYHGMYNMFASSRSKGGKDQAAMSRWASVNAIVKLLRGLKEIEARWLALHNSCVQYVRFASERPEDGRFKSGAKILLEKSQYGAKLQEVIGMKMPPATMKIELRKDCNYKNVPIITKWSREFSIASGISAPKIITATASNGQRYKELFKAGNDDLRQDAIMEQVFEQVSELLVSHRDTRQRRLGIRSYKVLPLTAGSGVIEFVSNTIPINDYLVPAHAEHHPTDLKASAARKIIQDAAASGRNDHRVMEYRRVCEKFHPVMRYFFMERFGSPDDWFEKRLAYTRSTAAVSMLGHILGLGDRHGHNILLDEKTGEVVHIDLGIAFEQGRILPVPELVPFRLTRDVVDGMGVTKTEGVFRRCCEFTLDALRKEHYSIMTILDVLRYDPLYSWSLSPLRLKRLQEDKMNDDDESAINARIPGSDKPEKKENEEAEAERALTVVAKKLSRSLSVEATVNELIQQASDERNLALLFAGWAAYI